MNRCLYRVMVWMVIGISVFFFSGCGGGDESVSKRSLDIVFLNTDNEIPVESIQNAAREFASQQADVIVNTTAVEVDPDVPFEEIVSYFRHVDVVFYPSLLVEQIGQHANLFYPLALEDERLPDDLLAYFQKEGDEGYWSVPVLIDPVVMLVRKSAMRTIGDEKFPESWAKLLLVSEFGHSAMAVSYPNMVIYDSSPYAVADAIAAYYLSRGLFYDSIFGEGYSPTMEEEMHEIAQQQILMSLARFQAKDPAQIESSFVKRKSMKEFADSIALFTFIRLSEFQREADEIQSQFFSGIMKNPYDKNPVLCYSVNTSVSLESDEPVLSQAFIRSLAGEDAIDQKEDQKIAGQNTVQQEKTGVEATANEAAAIEETAIEATAEPLPYLRLLDWKSNGLIPTDSVMVLRHNSKTLHEKALFDCMEGKKKTLDFQDILMIPYEVMKN